MRAEVCDVVIVGAGACGSVVARELAGRGFSVVVVEAGRRFDAAIDLRELRGECRARSCGPSRAFMSARIS